jgi:phytoene synthase
MLSENSRTFFAASLLLPRSVREPASALYAFCRLADDAVDLPGAARDPVSALRERLSRLYEGNPWDHPADRAFAEVVRRYAIPRGIPDALLEGFEWDIEQRRYETLDELMAYAARVAGTVGAMMSLLMGARSSAAVARACDLGVAMQLSNIARDVGEDARAGRIYLPLIWLKEDGIDPDDWLRDPVFSSALGSVVAKLLQAADSLYARVGAGVALLPAGCRPGINAARFLYAEIGREVGRANHDSVTKRAVVPAARKATLLIRALTTTVAKPLHDVPALGPCQFLIDRVKESPLNPSTPSMAPERVGWNVEERIVWLIDLFERLERRDRHPDGSADPLNGEVMSTSLPS